MEGTKQYRWLPACFWLGLLAYSLIATVGARVVIGLLRYPQRYESAWVILVMLVFISACMATERGAWPVWKRVAFVPAAWVAVGILELPASFLFVPLIWAGQRALLDQGIAFVASLPLVILAMRRSRMFATRVQDAPDVAP